MSIVNISNMNLNPKNVNLNRWQCKTQGSTRQKPVERRKCTSRYDQTRGGGPDDKANTSRYEQLWAIIFHWITFFLLVLGWSPSWGPAAMLLAAAVCTACRRTAACSCTAPCSLSSCTAPGSFSSCCNDPWACLPSKSWWSAQQVSHAFFAPSANPRLIQEMLTMYRCWWVTSRLLSPDLAQRWQI